MVKESDRRIGAFLYKSHPLYAGEDHALLQESSFHTFTIRFMTRQ